MQTFVNGHLVFNMGEIDENYRGKRMIFDFLILPRQVFKLFVKFSI